VVQFGKCSEINSRFPSRDRKEAVFSLRHGRFPFQPPNRLSTREFPLDGLLLEACLLHFRVVWDFFYRPKKKRTDVVVRDYIPGWTDVDPPARLRDIREKGRWLDVIIAHLTTHRVDPNYKVGEITDHRCRKYFSPHPLNNLQPKSIHPTTDPPTPPATLSRNDLPNSLPTKIPRETGCPVHRAQPGPVGSRRFLQKQSQFYP